MILQDPKTRIGRIKLYAAMVTEIASVNGERPSLVLALGYRESWLTFAPGYKPKGDPCGRGDSGFAHGIFQIDHRYHSAFVNSPGFESPAEQCGYACSLLAENRLYISHALPSIRSSDLERGVYAAYNASVEKVTRLLEQGLDPDGCTTGKDYSRYIFTFAQALENSYPALVTLPEGGGDFELEDVS